MLTTSAAISGFLISATLAAVAAILVLRDHRRAREPQPVRVHVNRSGRRH